MRARTAFAFAPSALALIAVVLVAPGASAKKKKPVEEAPPPPERSVEFSAGARGQLGGGLYTTPSGAPAETLGFMGSAGGIGWGAQAYFEARFVKYLGVELGLGYDSQDLHRNVTFNGSTTVTERVVSKGIRIPLLIKGVVPTPFGRISLGLGPEFVAASTPEASLDPANVIVTKISAEKVSNVRLGLDFGMAFELPANLEIPFGLHASKSLGQPDAWNQRVSYELSGTTLTSYTVKAESTWDFRMSLGLGYRF
jgi:hypothetical protein